MVVSLCCWLVCNKVEGKKIAVLTPYRGQVACVCVCVCVCVSVCVCVCVCVNSIIIIMYYCNAIMLSHLQLDVIKHSLEDKAMEYREMPTDLLDVDVYTVDEYQVWRKQMACHTVYTCYSYDSACFQFSVYAHCYYSHIGS